MSWHVLRVEGLHAGLTPVSQETRERKSQVLCIGNGN